MEEQWFGPLHLPSPFPGLHVTPLSATLPWRGHEGTLSGFDTVRVTLTQWQDGTFFPAVARGLVCGSGLHS